MTGWMLMLLACGSSAGGSDMVVREGVATLEKHIHVPEVLHEVRWAARAKGGASAVPGPTDLELVAWFPVPDADRAAVEAMLGAPQGDGDERVPAALSAALPASLAGERDGDDVVLHGVKWPGAPFENIRWTAAFVLWVPGGLVVSLDSR